MTFKAVNNSDDDQAFDLTKIQPVKLDGSPFDTAAGSGKQICGGGVRIRKMLNIQGKYDTEYWYYSTLNYDGQGWFEGSKTATKTKIATDTIFLKKGERSELSELAAKLL